MKRVSETNFSEPTSVRGGSSDTQNMAPSQQSARFFWSWENETAVAGLFLLTLLEPQSRFGDKPLKFQVVCPQNETAVLKGLMRKNWWQAFFVHFSCVGGFFHFFGISASFDPNYYISAFFRALQEPFIAFFVMLGSFRKFCFSILQNQRATAEWFPRRVEVLPRFPMCSVHCSSELAGCSYHSLVGSQEKKTWRGRLALVDAGGHS